MPPRQEIRKKRTDWDLINLRCPQHIHIPYTAVQPQIWHFLFFFFSITKRVFYLSPLEVWMLSRFLDWGLMSLRSFNFGNCLTPSSFSRTATFTVKLREFSQFKPGLLQHFDFSNKDTAEQINRLASLSSIFPGADPSFQSLVCTFRTVISIFSFRSSGPVDAEQSGLSNTIFFFF